MKHAWQPYSDSNMKSARRCSQCGIVNNTVSASEDPCPVQSAINVAYAYGVPATLVVTYARGSILFSDGKGDRFEPSVSQVLEVIRIMSEHARDLMSESERRLTSIEERFTDPGYDIALRAIAGRTTNEDDRETLVFLAQKIEDTATLIDERERVLHHV